MNFGGSTSETSKSNLLSTLGSRFGAGSFFSAWTGSKPETDKPKEPEKKEETATSPWGLDRPRPGKKDKTGPSFGGFNEVQETNVEEKKEDSFDFGFGSTGKKDSKKKKTSIWDPEPEKDEPLVDKLNPGSTAVNDPWQAWGAKKKGTTTAASEPEKIEPMVETPPTNDLLASSSKKSKKKKNGIIEEVKEPDPPPAPEPEPEPAADDGWSWGGTKKDKTTGKSAKESDSVPEVANKKEEDDFWGTIATSKKDKKKKNKIAVAEPKPEPPTVPEPEPEPEPEPVVEPEPEKKADDGLGAWGVSTTTTSKKKGKKGKVIEEVKRLEPEPEPPTIPDPVPDPPVEPEKEDDWGGAWGVTTKKKGKKSKVVEEVKDTEPVPEPGPEPPAEPDKKEESWGGWGVTTSKKDKKKKKGAIEEIALEPEPKPEPEPEPIAVPDPPKKEIEDIWNIGTTSKDKKKKKKKGALETELEPEPPVPEPIREPTPEPEPEPEKNADDEFWAGLGPGGKKDKKKKKKGAAEESPKEPEPEAIQHGETALDDWGSAWGTSSNDKKKKGILDDFASKELNTDSLAQNDDDPWTSKEKKKSKNAITIEESFKEKERDPVPGSKYGSQESGSSAWSFWGATKKPTKKAKEEPPPPPVEESDGWLNWGKKKLKASLVENEKELDHQDHHDAPPAVPEAPGAADGDDFWGSFSASKDKTGSSLMPDSIEEPKNDDPWGFATSKKDKKKKGSKNIAIEIENGSHLNGVKPDSVEESRGGKHDYDDWGWGNMKGQKHSPPPAPTPPSLNMSLSGQELDGNVWDDAAKAEEDERAAAEAEAELAAEIAAEEDEIKKLTAKSKKKKKLNRADQERLDELLENAARRAEVKAAKEAEEAAQREADEKAAAEALEAEQKAAAEALEAEEKAAAEAREAEEKAAAEALEAEIAAEEAEIAALTAKSKKKKKFTKNDQKRLDELTERASARAEKAALDADKDAEADEEAAREAEEREAEEQAAREAEEQEAREAEELAAREAEEKAAREAEEEAAREAEEQAKREREEAEAAAKKKSKKSSKAEEKKSKSSSKSKKEKEKEEREKEKERERLEREKEEREREEREEREREEDEEKENNKYDDDDDDLDLDNLDLAPEQVDELLSGFSSPVPKSPPITSKADAFSFWGAKPKSSSPERVLEDAAIDDAPSSFKVTTTDDDWMKPKKTKVKGSKLSEKLRKFEPAKEEDDDDLIDALAAPPPPPRVPAAPPTEERSSRDLLPGAFPDEQDENEIIEIVDMAPVERKKKGKKSKSKAVEVPPPPPAIAIPPPPPEVPIPPPAAPDAPDAAEAPDAPPTPPPEIKSSKKERAKINRDAGASWGMWSASPRKEERRPKPKPEEKRPRKEREKEKSSSSKGSSSDRDTRTEERREKKSAPTPKQRTNSIFQSTPPISRSMSTREKRPGATRSSSRRHSLEMTSGLVSPPPEEIPVMSSKAAKVFGVDKSQKSHSRKISNARFLDDEDIVMTTEAPPSPERTARKRSKPKAEEEMFMTDGGFPIDATPLKRSNSSAKKGLAGLFGGLKSTPRTEMRPEPPRRRSTYYTTDDEIRPDKRAKGSSRDYRGIDVDAMTMRKLAAPPVEQPVVVRNTATSMPRWRMTDDDVAPTARNESVVTNEIEETNGIEGTEEIVVWVVRTAVVMAETGHASLSSPTRLPEAAGGGSSPAPDSLED
ncbi:hypothetical protein F4776DRAFT_292566 [Hypoxylon sp. NC0597]|nr:hypothetical protein F4776DRAFT_292566 [Hypoxylon sp. NC0597]